jgi:hypothetical protein
MLMFVIRGQVTISLEREETALQISGRAGDERLGALSSSSGQLATGETLVVPAHTWLTTRNAEPTRTPARSSADRIAARDSRPR